MRKYFLTILMLLFIVKLSAAEFNVSTVAELKNAVSIAQPGDIIWVADGSYAISTSPGINITRSGNSTSFIKLFASEGASPVFDFSGQPRNNGSARGMALKADYWHIRGIDFYAAGDNGLIISGGHHNIIEQCNFYECNDSGVQIDNGSSNNLVLNCDSYFNADASNENADGFAAKLGVGNYNTFKGCRAWRNLDDGFDGYLRGADDITTYFEDCWTIQNGYDKTGAAGSGDGNGFKTGGSDDKTLKHHADLIRCIAVGNRVKGFDHNSNRGDITLLNCAATANGTNISFGNTNPVNKLTIKNTVVVGVTGPLNATIKDISHNSWNGAITANSFDYEDFTNYFDQMTAPRKSDGSLPDVAFWKLLPSSDLIDAGTDVGQWFSGTAPDIGPFEFIGSTVSVNTLHLENYGMVISEKYFSLNGQQIDKNAKGFMVVLRTYENGKVVAEKIYHQ